ncbi:Retrovirus-related Pol polyprotein [Arachis hypogaea]|nr:Retrovirus-related Pol polyprotein [Arachis hypogaea]
MVKYYQDGSINKYKPRLVALGCHQKPSFDFKKHSEEVYMKQLFGYEAENDKMVCELIRSLYGLKQAPRRWFTKLTSSLVSLGFAATKSDASLFHRTEDLVKSLNACFSLKDLGDLHYFLGIEVRPIFDGLLLTQSKYILDVIKKVGL